MLRYSATLINTVCQSDDRPKDVKETRNRDKSCCCCCWARTIYDCALWRNSPSSNEDISSIAEAKNQRRQQLTPSGGPLLTLKCRQQGSQGSAKCTLCIYSKLWRTCFIQSGPSTFCSHSLPSARQSTRSEDDLLYSVTDVCHTVHGYSSFYS